MIDDKNKADDEQQESSGSTSQESSSPSADAPPRDGNWEAWGRTLAQKAINQSLKREARMWWIRWIVRGILLIYLGMMLFILMTCSGVGTTSGRLNKNVAHIAVIDIVGEISEQAAVRAEWVIPSLREAFEHKNSVAVMLRVNSPGGSPVQSSYIYDEIIRLRQQHPNKKIYAVVSEQCLSGGYYIASATNIIYANRASLVGSIGARMGSFSYIDAMKKIGIERRVVASANKKLFLDPFSIQTKENIAHAQHLVDEIHQQFVEAIQQGRGSRLVDSPEIFSGLMWTGPESVELGLIDGLGDVYRVINEVGGKPEMVNYSPPRRMLDEILDQVSLRVRGAVSALLI